MANASVGNCGTELGLFLLFPVYVLGVTPVLFAALALLIVRPERDGSRWLYLGYAAVTVLATYGSIDELVPVASSVLSPLEPAAKSIALAAVFLAELLHLRNHLGGLTPYRVFVLVELTVPLLAIVALGIF